MESYPSKYRALFFDQQINKNSKILSFSPYLTDEKILCVGGRINAGNIPITSKNQMIVSKMHYLSNLKIMDIH